MQIFEKKRKWQLKIEDCHLHNRGKEAIAETTAVKRKFLEENQPENLREIFERKLKAGTINTNLVHVTMPKLKFTFKGLSDSGSEKNT